MDNDDRQLGQILSRREVLALLGAAGTVVLVGCGTPQAGTSATAPAGTGAASGATAEPTLNAEAQTAQVIATNPSAQASQGAAVATAEVANATVTVPACVVRPEVTEGPYYVDVDLIRSDIRTDNATGEAQPGTPLVLTVGNAPQAAALQGVRLGAFLAGFSPCKWRSSAVNCQRKAQTFKVSA